MAVMKADPMSGMLLDESEPYWPYTTGVRCSADRTACIGIDYNIIGSDL